MQKDTLDQFVLENELMRKLDKKMGVSKNLVTDTLAELNKRIVEYLGMLNDAKEKLIFQTLQDFCQHLEFLQSYTKKKYVIDYQEPIAKLKSGKKIYVNPEFDRSNYNNLDNPVICFVEKKG